MDDNTPMEELSPLRQMGAVAHEVFLAFLEAGFTESQAIQMTIGMIKVYGEFSPPQFPQQNST
jgi:hypothetical protein